MPILGSFAGISSKAYGLTSSLVGDYFFIAKASAPSGAVASLDFTSIPQDYTHLEIRITHSITVSGQWLAIRFNSDTSANYNSTNNYYENTPNNGRLNESGATYARNGYGETGGGVTQPSYTIMQIQQYKNTNIFKSYTHYCGSAGTATVGTFQGGGLWRSGSAITSISIFPIANNLVQYSQAYLYGIK